MSAQEKLASDIHDFVLAQAKTFGPSAGKTFAAKPIWERLRELGTELWLDTGSLEESGALWDQTFSALTTNNTLLNKEVQTGQYDALIAKANKLLSDYELDERERLLEIAFILNATHGLRLVAEYDAYVSVEEHTDLAHDLERAVSYARRYHAICPERFFVKIPLTPAGVLATRRLAKEGIPVNHTLGFSARQNYVAARLAGPAYVNVFLGRLNSFVSENGLGSGQYVGEKATLASQAAVRALREERGVPTKQIGASIRNGQQIADLAGLDVLTMPPKAAQGFLDLNLSPDALADATQRDYQPGVDAGPDAAAAGLETLWTIDDQLVECLDAAEKEDLDAFTADDLMDCFEECGCRGLFVRWTHEQIAASAAEGKIPALDTWRAALARGEIGLDALMNLAGLNSFTADQRAMDERVAGVLSGQAS